MCTLSLVQSLIHLENRDPRSSAICPVPGLGGMVFFFLQHICHHAEDVFPKPRPLPILPKPPHVTVTKDRDPLGNLN